MNGKAIIVDIIFGIYQVKIVNFDNGHAIERHEGGLTRKKAFETAFSWSKETGFPVRGQVRDQLCLVEKRDITNHTIMNDYIGKKVLVRSYGAGVYFGTLEKLDGETAKLTNVNQHTDFSNDH